jgi:hypothetical protein
MNVVNLPSDVEKRLEHQPLGFPIFHRLIVPGRLQRRKTVTSRGAMGSSRLARSTEVGSGSSPAPPRRSRRILAAGCEQPTGASPFHLTRPAGAGLVHFDALVPEGAGDRIGLR